MPYCQYEPDYKNFGSISKKLTALQPQSRFAVRRRSNGICGKSAKILKNSYITQEKTDYNNIYALTYRKSLCYNKLSYNQGGIYEQRGIY